jgi:hypothetical protein
VCFCRFSTFGVNLVQNSKPRVYGSCMTHSAENLDTKKDNKDLPSNLMTHEIKELFLTCQLIRNMYAAKLRELKDNFTLSAKS